MIEVQFGGREEEVIRELSEKFGLSPERTVRMALAAYQWTCERILDGYVQSWLKDGEPHPDDIVYGLPDLD